MNDGAGESFASQATRLATGWLLLGVGALALAGLFAVLLVLARTPGLQGLFPAVGFFRTALVVHVNESVLIWFLAFAGALWSLRGERQSALVGGLGLAAAVAGAGLLAASPWLGAGEALMSNYVPVLHHRTFFVALSLFAVGVLLIAVSHLAAAAAPGARRDPMQAGLTGAAAAVVVSALSLAWSWATLASGWAPEAYFEHLFWGPGHVLQFAYTQLMVVAWIWLSGALGLRLPISPHWLRALLWLAVTPLLLVPVIHALHAPDSGPARIAFTRLMQFGNAIAAVPVGLGLLWALARERPGGQRLGAPGRALIASLVLFACGGVIGALISGVNTVIPAHYHGSIVGVTLALMGLTYHLLPALGFGRPAGRLARWQPGLYGAGQLLHVAGLAISGAMGVQRKTAGSAQMLEGWQAKAAMGVMGIGGLLAVLGGILFVVVVGRCLLARGTPPR